MALDVDGRRISVPGCPGLKVGAPAAVIVRPEALSLGSGSSTELSGMLVDASFLGSQTVYTVNVEGCGQLTVADSRLIATMPAPGEEVRLGFAAADAWAVAA
jgi:ABC-type Fe3+/spermidine/putrescine transport system ATPase subunit